MKVKLNYFPVKPGDIVVNLGACVGEVTKFYSNRVGEKGLVLAVEPEENNFNKLKEALSWAPNVLICGFAMSNRNGVGYLNVGGNPQQHSIVRDFFGPRQEVTLITWDTLIRYYRLGPIALAKIDIEGAELQLLEGMTSNMPRYIIMEEHSRFGCYDRVQLLDALSEKGYIWHTDGWHIYAQRVLE